MGYAPGHFRKRLQGDQGQAVVQRGALDSNEWKDADPEPSCTVEGLILLALHVCSAGKFAMDS
eukprot:11163464-Lingulodinium_polyedra.AAC.1